MNRLTFTCLFFLAALTALSAQVLFEENFEAAGLPAGWTIETNANDGGWLVGTSNALSSDAFPIANNGSSRIIATNDDGCNCNKSEEYLITPAFDLTDVDDVILSFDAFYRDEVYQGAQEDASIEVSLDGENWIVLEDLHGHGSWDRHTVDLSPYAGEATVYVGFRYHDAGGWLYGFAIDNVVLEVPPTLEVALVEVEGGTFGEVGMPISIKGTVYNAGVSTITSLEIAYTVGEGAPVVETINGLIVPGFGYYMFEISAPWLPSAAGMFEVVVNVLSVNGEADEDETNNSLSFDAEIFPLVEVPNKIDEFAAAPAIITEVEGAAVYLDKPTDLDFFPILGKDELWVINQRTENAGGSTLTMRDATSGTPDYDARVDGNAWHFMSLPTALAFSSDNFNFASSPGVQDANHGGGTFTGPTLWSSDPDIYAQPSGGNGSHLDMLHGSPFSMGIAHEVDNAFWIYDDWNKDIIRYDFVGDHGPGNDDHSDGMVRRYRSIGIDADGDIPNHMILDKDTGWLYFVDNGNDRVMRLDINSGSVGSVLPEINEPLSEHTRMVDFTVEVIIEEGLEAACGIELFENILYVGDYATGDIVAYDIESDFAEITRIATGQTGLTGIKVGPDGNIWFVNRLQNTLSIAEPDASVDVQESNEKLNIAVSPNPTSGELSIRFPDDISLIGAQISLSNLAGQSVLSAKVQSQLQVLDLTGVPAGVYLLSIENNEATVTKHIVVQH